MPDSEKRRISAKQILADIRNGMDDALLKHKYGLSDKALDSVYRKLVDAGALGEADIKSRSGRATTDGRSSEELSGVTQWQCPSCRAPQASEMEECPVCGILVAKFLARQESDKSLGVAAKNIPQAESSRSRKWGAAVARVVVLVAVGLAAAWFLLRPEPEPPAATSEKPWGSVTRQAHPNKNALAINDRATADVLDIQPQPLKDLDFKTKSQVLSLRRVAVSRYPSLISGKYQPSDAVFGQIVDGVPWWGLLGAYCYGKGERSIAGPSLHSESILNPYFLVIPSFNTWRSTNCRKANERTAYKLFYCPPRSLRWYPKRGQAEVTYDMECLRRSGSDDLSLDAYNARDLNLNYVYVSYGESSNISKHDQPARAYKNPQYIHKGGSCGYPGGCNNRSPYTPPLDDIQILGWPVKIVVYLWESNPDTVDTPPDMEYVIHFN